MDSAEIISNLLLFALVFGMSATVEISQLKHSLKQKVAILSIIFTQFFIMPLLGFAAVMSLTKLGGMSGPMGITLLIVTSSPGGSYSNWWCSIFNADLALSVTLTAMNTLLSSFFLPANLMLYTTAYAKLRHSRGEESVLSYINWHALFISLCVVVASIFCGIAASYYNQKDSFRLCANRFGSIAGVALITFSLIISTHHGMQDAENPVNLWSLPWSFYVGVTFPCIAGLIVSLFFGELSRLSRPQRVTLSVETCYQNVGIASSVALSMFDNPSARAEALCVPIFYGLVEAVVLAFFCLIAWKRGWTKAPKEEKFCVMLVKTYEVQLTDDENTIDSSPNITNVQIPKTRALSKNKRLDPIAFIYQLLRRCFLGGFLDRRDSKEALKIEASPSTEIEDVTISNSTEEGITATDDASQSYVCEASLANSSILNDRIELKL